jgi:large subunit ribosomal protein L23
MNQTQAKQKLEHWQNVMKENFSPVFTLSGKDQRAERVVDLVKKPVITEKSYIAMFKNRQYTFDVDLRLTKPQIKKLFETLFEIQIIGINTHCPARQKVRMGMTQGYRPRYKRVILTLKEGQSISFISGNM